MQKSFSILLGLTVFILANLTAQNLPTSTPEKQGISSEAILSFIDRAEKEIDVMHSFIILKNGYKVSEGWWDPYKTDAPHTMHSMSKSFTSTAIGLAIEEGKLSLHDLVISFFPEYAPEDPSWQLQSLRVRDLLSMNTGHIREPFIFTQPANWAKYFLEEEIDFKPGTHFTYNSAATYILAVILQKVTGESLVDYLNPRLFQPLGIEKPEWDMGPDGVMTGGWGLHVRTEDIAKLGQLYLQKGMWNGDRLLSENWVEMATSKQSSNGSNPDSDWDQGYGFQFWMCRHNAYRGDGAMGQFSIVIPEHDVVIAITSGVYDMGAVMNLVWEELLPHFKTEAIPENPATYEKLKLKTVNLTLPAVAGNSSSSSSKKLKRKTFKVDENSTQVDEIQFELHGDNHRIHFLRDDQTETLELGFNSFEEGRLNYPVAYTPNWDHKIGASGAWITEQEYEVRIYFSEAPERLTYVFKFEEDQVTWSSRLEFSLLSDGKPVEVTGKSE
jgi:CubicO group peptidase (beta-lactamase class C family)